MTVSEVLDYLEISPPMFSMIKSGQRNPSVKTIRRIESAEREVGILPKEPEESDRAPPTVRESKADAMPDHRDLSKKLDEILRRLDNLEKRYR